MAATDVMFMSREATVARRLRWDPANRPVEEQAMSEPIEARLDALEQSVRRLQDVVERHFPPLVVQELRDRLKSKLEPSVTPPAETLQAVAPISLDDQIRELEAMLIGWAMKVSHGNKSRAADLLKVKRSTLGDRINRCGVGHVETVGSSAPPDVVLAESRSSRAVT